MDSTIDFTMEEFCKKYSEFKHLIPFLTGKKGYSYKDFKANEINLCFDINKQSLIQSYVDFDKKMNNYFLEKKQQKQAQQKASTSFQLNDDDDDDNDNDLSLSELIKRFIKLEKKFDSFEMYFKNEISKLGLREGPNVSEVVGDFYLGNKWLVRESALYAAIHDQSTSDGKSLFFSVFGEDYLKSFGGVADFPPELLAAFDQLLVKGKVGVSTRESYRFTISLIGD
ncbi:hypothetical protein BLOT_007929, partial [Blomia tropicalis]